MSFSRPHFEDVFVKDYLKREIRALQIDSDLQQKFVQFAAKAARADSEKFKARVYHVLHGRVPSAYITLLLIDFFSKRKYEDIVRKTIDHVEYITPDGKTADLEKFVVQHPQFLRILKIKCQESGVAVVLRTPIAIPNWDGLTSREVDKQWEVIRLEFQKWLGALGPLPDTVAVLQKEKKVEYWPEASEPRYPGEFTFEEISNDSAMLEIWDAVDLLLLCSLGEKAPIINPNMLDLFYSLSEILGRDRSKKTADEYPAKRLWEQLAKHASFLPHIFYQDQNCFSPKAIAVLKSFFDDFAKTHKKQLKWASKDRAKVNRLGEQYAVNTKVFRRYENIGVEYGNALRPIVYKLKKQIMAAFMKAMAIYQERAEKHFSKLREALPNE